MECSADTLESCLSLISVEQYNSLLSNRIMQPLSASVMTWDYLTIYIDQSSGAAPEAIHVMCQVIIMTQVAIANYTIISENEQLHSVLFALSLSNRVVPGNLS